MNNTPDYKNGYWMGDRANNLILKKIVDFLKNYGDGGSAVKAMLDGQKHVHLMVQRGNHQEKIIFGAGFPNEAPGIEVSGEVEVNNVVEWRFDGDIYDSFVRYYDECFRNGTTAPTEDDDKIEIKPRKGIVAFCISRDEMKEILRSPQSVVNGSILCSDTKLLYNSVTQEFDVVLDTDFPILQAKPSDSSPWTVLFFKGKAFDYPQETYIVEDIQTEHPSVSYVESDGDKREWSLVFEDQLPNNNNINKIHLFRNQREEIINSTQQVVIGHTYLGVIYNATKFKFEYVFDVILTPKRFGSMAYAVYLYKGKADSYQGEAFVVEDIQTEQPKAFFVRFDGSKTEATIRLIDEDFVKPDDDDERDLTIMTDYGGFV